MSRRMRRGSRTSHRKRGERLSFRRPDRAFNLAEAAALAPAAHRKRIAGLEERALHPAAEFNRLAAVPAYLQEAAALVLFRAGYGAGAQEIADIHGAAACRVVHQLLHRG